MRAYFTLLERDTTSAPWGIAFGDYCRTVVVTEMWDHIYAADAAPRPDQRWTIIRTGDTQAEIDAAVAALNQGAGP
jgi:hypothetical protein